MWPWQWLLFWRGVSNATLGTAIVLTPAPDGERPVAADRMCIASADVASQIKAHDQGGTRLDQVQFLMRCPGHVAPQDAPIIGRETRYWFGNNANEVMILHFDRNERVILKHTENLQ